MKQQALAFLLILSACFNVFFLAGSWQARTSHGDQPTDKDIVDIVSEALDLDEQQRQVYAEIRADYDAYKAARNERKFDEHAAFWAELVKDEPNAEVLQEFIRQGQGDDRREMFVKNMTRLMAVLRPEQRHKAAEFFQARYRDHKK